MADIRTLDHRDNFGSWLMANNFSGTGVEVGVQYGENAKRILTNYDGRMILIDPYKTWEKGEYIDGCNLFDMEVAKEFSRRYLERFNDRIDWRYSTSTDELKSIPGNLDFVYLDGCHHNPVLRQDIEGYWERVRNGGVLCGHDYCNVRTEAWVCEVEAEVQMFCEMNGLTVHTTPCTSWWIQK